LDARLTQDIFPQLLITGKYVKYSSARFVTDNIILI